MPVEAVLPALCKALLVGAGACALAATAGRAAPPDAADLPPVSALRPNPEMPDPLVMFDGRPVTSRAQWTQERRPELKRLFQHYMYGGFPPPLPVHTTVERTDPKALGGKATLREVTLSFGPGEGAENAPPIHLLLVTPNHRHRRAPVFLGANFCGNHAVLPDPAIRLPDGWMYPDGAGVVHNHATDAGRGSAVATWNIEGSVDRGYAVATFYDGDVEPDYPNAPEGLRARCVWPGRQKGGPHDCGTIAAWAWGLQRAADYLRTVKEVDPKRIAVVGHSRLGKAAILAAAFDERIALAIPLQAGCGGTAPSRGTVGESVKQINDHFPHWFCDTFKEFNDQPDRLPFDQNDLVALVAPRPVLFSCAEEDTWANPAGQFNVLKAADKTYRFLGVDGLDAETMPPSEHLLSSRLGYFIRPGKHSMTLRDWQAFWDFADRWLKEG